MAMTLISSPQTYSPVYNGLPCVVLSDNIGEPGFQYMFSVTTTTVDDVSSNTQTIHRVDPNPTTGYGAFDPMRLMESILTNDPMTAADLDENFITTPNSYGYMVITPGESYLVAGVRVDYPFEGLFLISGKYPFNGSLEFLDFINYNEATYKLTDSTSKFLTSSPTSQNINLTERAWLYSINLTPTNYSRRQVKTYNSAGTLLNTYNTTNTLSGNVDIYEELKNNYIRTSAGPAQLSDFGVSFSGVSYYTVQAQKSDGTPISELKTFVLKDNCKYTPVRIHFLNTLGGFDSFTFNKASTEETAISRTSYTRGLQNSPATSDRMKTTSSVLYEPSIQVTSDWLTESENTWLKQLVTSPVIYQELDGNLIAVVCKEVKYKTEKKLNNKLFNLSIGFEYTFQNNRQRY